MTVEVYSKAPLPAPKPHQLLDERDAATNSLGHIPHRLLDERDVATNSLGHIPHRLLDERNAAGEVEMEGAIFLPPGTQGRKV